MVSLRGFSTAPSSGASSPTMRRKTVLLPAPLGPTSPTFSPGLIWKEASTNRICPPYCLVTEENAITGRVHIAWRARARSDADRIARALHRLEIAGSFAASVVIARGSVGRRRGALERGRVTVTAIDAVTRLQLAVVTEGGQEDAASGHALVG